MRSKAAIQASKAAFAEARPNYVGPDGRCVRAGNGTVNNAERPAYFVWAPAPATAPPPPTPEWPSAQPPRSGGKKRREQQAAHVVLEPPYARDGEWAPRAAFEKNPVRFGFERDAMATVAQRAEVAIPTPITPSVGRQLPTSEVWRRMAACAGR